MRAFRLFILFAFTAPAVVADDGDVQFFESKIRPLLAENCYTCHSAVAKKLKAKLYLDSREGALKGGESGPAIIPNSPQTSRLIEAVNYKNPDLQMPPKAKLTDQQIADLTTWIKQGAPWGKSIVTATPTTTTESFDLQKRKATHWAWQPIQSPTPPLVKETTWPKNDIDRFILAKLESNQLHPARPADKPTLLRRLSFDLIGLPPTPQELQSFLDDQSPNAYEKQIDRLLASPHYGERWARHWLDLVRYSETMGHEFDFPIPNAWHYRDYVIRAYNDDLPISQFLTEQIAGDLLPNPRRNQAGQNQSILGTAFWFLGEDVQAPVDVRQHQADLMDNRIDVLGKSMLGLTIACARCHDHKFDAISTADYYALYGYAKGARYSQRAINETEITTRAAELLDLKQKIRKAAAQSWLDRWDSIVRLIPNTAPAAESFAAREDDIELLANHFENWKPDGQAFTAAPIAEFTIGQPTRPIKQLLTTPAYHSALLSKRLEGHLRAPAFTITKPYLHLRAAGSGARINVVVDNFVVIRDPIYGGLKKVLKSESPAWHTIDLSMWQYQQAYIELADTTVADPGGPASPEDAWAQLERATLSDNPKPPHATKSNPPNVNTSDLLRTTIEQWRDDKLADAPDASARATLLNTAMENGWLDGEDENVKQLLTQYRETEKSLPAPEYALAAQDADAGDEHVFIRGNPKTQGPQVQRRFLQALDSDLTHSGLEATATTRILPTSGRLELAAKIANPTNPLTARVYVNRIWHHLFAQGIVPSTDNFGALGEKPSHPELLDYLATQFIQHNWSTKTLIRQIVLSNTYQQSSAAIGNSQSTDPTNKLLHHQNLKRLDAESLRDHLLCISGRLDPPMFGPPIPIHLTPFMEGRGKPTTNGPLDGQGRRSIYLEVRRNFLNPMLLAFDMPTPFNTMGKRTVSNVPAQALILMNDPFIHQQARQWAKQILSTERTEQARLIKMYQQAYARPPTPTELNALDTYLNNQTDEETWTNLAHAIINTKEFIFLN